MRLLLVHAADIPSLQAIPVLQANGLFLDRIEHLTEAADALASVEYRAVLLHCARENAAALAWLRRQRERGLSLPVVAVIAVDDVEDRIGALDAGADGCVPRTITGRELLACLRAVLRRPPHLVSSVLEAGNVRLDITSRQVWIGDALIRIPRRELSLLEHLMSRNGRVVPRAALEDDLYGLSQDSCPNSIEVRVSRVRRHLCAAGATVEIQTVRGVGYLLAPLSSKAWDGPRQAHAG